MLMIWSKVYNATLFGIVGSIILLSFFAIVWIWMKKYAALDIQEKIAGSYKHYLCTFEVIPPYVLV